jgi:murein endopeptidase
MKSLKWIGLALVVALFDSGCSQNVVQSDQKEVLPNFCQEWNPDFSYNGGRCSPNFSKLKRKKVAGCNVSRRQFSYCGDMTPAQVSYSELVGSNRNLDALTLISSSDRSQEQAMFSVNDGFLVQGRRVIPTSYNHLALRFPSRCTNFGTDAMAGMLEWLGHEVGKTYSAKKFSGVKLVVGDLAAPRGGCLWGHNQRVCHKSHKNGQDADIGYLSVKPGRPSPIEFHQVFDAKKNYWFLKKVFHNPYACVRIVFLDRRNIHKLAHFAGSDPEWRVMRRYIQHAAGHHNHFHIRIGNGPGAPGCVAPGIQMARN